MFLRKSLIHLIFMFINSSFQAIRYSSIQCSISLVSNYINVSHTTKVKIKTDWILHIYCLYLFIASLWSLFIDKQLVLNDDQSTLYRFWYASERRNGDINFISYFFRDSQSSTIHLQSLPSPSQILPQHSH